MNFIWDSPTYWSCATQASVTNTSLFWRISSKLWCKNLQLFQSQIPCCQMTGKKIRSTINHFVYSFQLTNQCYGIILLRLVYTFYLFFFFISPFHFGLHLNSWNSREKYVISLLFPCIYVGKVKFPHLLKQCSIHRLVTSILWIDT